MDFIKEEGMKAMTIPIEGLEAAMLLVIMILVFMAYRSKDDNWF